MQADLRNEESIIEVLKAVAGKLDSSGAVDILVNNAAIFNLESVDELTEAGKILTLPPASEVLQNMECSCQAIPALYPGICHCFTIQVAHTSRVAKICKP